MLCNNRSLNAKWESANIARTVVLFIVLALSISFTLNDGKKIYLELEVNHEQDMRCKCLTLFFTLVLSNKQRFLIILYRVLFLRCLFVSNLLFSLSSLLYILLRFSIVSSPIFPTISSSE